MNPMHSIQSDINELFKDMGCRSIALKSPNELEIDFLFFVEKDPSILERMTHIIEESISVIDESILNAFS